MGQKRLVLSRSFCWNQACPDYGKVNHGNVRKFGKTRKGTQWYHCKTCGHTFTETRGTVFHRRKHPPQTIMECLALLAGRNSLAAIHRVKGVKEETVSAWLREAAMHVEEIEGLLLANFPTDEWPAGAEDPFVLEGGEDARGCMCRGRLDVQSRPTVENTSN